MNRLSVCCRHRYASGFELDVAFQIAHQVTSLFGPSGSGKTTVLAMIAGALRPQAGRIELGGRMLVDTSQNICLAAEHRRVGLVFQDHLLFPHLNVEQNLRYGQRRRRVGASDIDFGQVVEVLELGDLLERMPRNLSGGQRQRVALGRSLLASPELLLLDEPLAALDAPLKDRILTYLERVVAQWRLPTIYVSHAASEVERLADWVIVLKQGRVAATGTPEQILKQQPQSEFGN
ncbi:MAG TPA: molybdenum ABC transporter ATP-binding protein [Pirellulales bacterium]|nr:molybdenum ABC transporter ATP-binding protein [Pirellulales bacterium]